MNNPLIIRDATPNDAPTILILLDQLGWSSYIRQRVTVEYIIQYIQFPYNNILLAELRPIETQIKNLDTNNEQPLVSVGLLSYSIRPDLYHGGDACLVENFIVSHEQRNKGIGSALFNHLLKRLYEVDCATIKVDVEPDNQDAIRFYLRHGLTNQVVLLERHLFDSI